MFVYEYCPHLWASLNNAKVISLMFVQSIHVYSMAEWCLSDRKCITLVVLNLKNKYPINEQIHFLWSHLQINNIKQCLWKVTWVQNISVNIEGTQWILTIWCYFCSCGVIFYLHLVDIVWIYFVFIRDDVTILQLVWNQSLSNIHLKQE